MMIALLVASCASQERPDDIDPDYEYPVDVRNTHEPPTTVQRLLERGEREEQQGRLDNARVTYQQIFRRDAWNPTAHTRYQNILYTSELFDPLWQEYTDLWQASPRSGIAWFFHLRPLMLKRTGERLGTDDWAVFQPTDEQRTLLDSAAKALTEDDSTAAASTLKELLDDSPALVPAHILWIQIKSDSATEAYEDLAMEHPTSGVAQALLARTLEESDPDHALKILHDAYVLGLNGQWLEYELGRVCFERAKAIDGRETENLRDRWGWFQIARWMMQQTLRSSTSPESAIDMYETSSQSIAEIEESGIQ